MERDVRFSPEIGDIHAGPTAWNEHPVRLLKNAAQQLQIFGEAEVVIVILLNVVGGRGDHQVDGFIWELAHMLRGLMVNSVDVLHRDGILNIWCLIWLQGPIIEAAVIE